MKTERKRTPAQWAVLLLIWCGPTLALLAMCRWALHIPLTRSNLTVLCVTALCGLIVTRLIFLFRSDSTAEEFYGTLAYWLFALLVLGFVALNLLPVERYQSTRQNAREQFEESVVGLCWEPGEAPAPLELGEPESAVYHIYLVNRMDRTDSRTLLCRYAGEDYAAEKAALEERYSFRTEPMNTGYNGKEVIVPTVTIGDDVFHVLRPEDGEKGYYDTFYKRCLLVVTNDTEREIGYISFMDMDLELHEARDLAEFVNEYCGWKYIRKGA